MKEKAVNLGLIGGGAIAVIMLIVDRVNNAQMVRMMMSYFPTLILIAAMVLSASDAKKNTDYLDFTGAFRAAFLPFVIGNGIYLIFNYLLYNYIDPELPDLARERALEIFDKGPLNMFMNEEDREKLIEATRENTFKPTVGEAFFGYMISLVFPGAAVALIIGAIFRTRNR